MADNASLQTNLSQATGQAPDPFSQARMQFQQQRAQDASLMQGGPVPMQMGAPDASSPPMQQPTMQQVQQPLKQADFPSLAAQHGIDTAGLSKSPDIGRLQLLQRMQAQFGPGFQQHQAFQPLMQAFDQHMQSNQPSRADQLAMSSKAQRTLKALMGADPWS